MSLKPFTLAEVVAQVSASPDAAEVERLSAIAYDAPKDGGHDCNRAARRRKHGSGHGSGLLMAATAAGITAAGLMSIAFAVTVLSRLGELNARLGTPPALTPYTESRRNGDVTPARIPPKILMLWYFL